MCGIILLPIITPSVWGGLQVWMALDQRKWTCIGLLIGAFAVGMSIPSMNALAIEITPKHISGATVVVSFLLIGIVSSMQHVIIGWLWNVTNDHRWYLLWIAILNVCLSTIAVVYGLVPKKSRQEFEEIV